MKKNLRRIFRFCFSFASLRLCAFAGIFFLSSYSQTLAPGAPGKDAQWASAGKQAVGTSNTLESKVWFTLQGGMLTEVFFPQVDTANVNVLQFVVVDPKTGKIETERDDANHKIIHNYGLNLYFEQRNEAKTGAWEIRKSYLTDPARNTVVFSLFFRAKDKDLKLYVYYDPSINNSGMNDTAWSQGGVLYASEKDITTAFVAREGFGNTITNGFFGTSDGLSQLRETGKIVKYERAENGNVVQFAEIKSNAFYSNKDLAWIWQQQFALGFGKTSDEAARAARSSLKENHTDLWIKYREGWNKYVSTLPKVDEKYQAQFNMAALVLRAFEDKTYRGGNVASLSVPWGGGNNGNETTTGYHLVWSRDLYQVATAYMALGNKASATSALEYLFKYQQRDDGSFPQISWLDGRTVGDSIQMDEISYPLILAYQLSKTDRETYEKNIKKSAEYIVKNGPYTKQERWEEEAGYSPSTIAAEIAGLVCAAEIARMNGDTESQKRWLEIADNWQKSIEKWTATTTGKYGDGNYYLRLSQNGKPDSGERLELGNGAGTFDEREIVDAGFLELVRLGVKPPDDPLIVKSLKVVDEVLMVKTPNGESFYRYNHDGYGDTYDGKRWNWDATWRGNGHLWALLSGERGQYELALANTGQRSVAQSRGGRNKPIQNPKSKIQNRELLTKTKSRLDAMLAFSNDGLMIPEQIWDKPATPKNIDLGFIPPTLRFGEGNGSATPLAWSMAQFIRLALNLKAGRNLETPDVVYNRYVKKP